VLSLLAAIAVFQSPAPAPSAPIQAPPVNTTGTGEPVAQDARITVHFSALTDDGQVLADTERRGMAFTFLMGQETVEPFWHDAVRNLRAGGARTVRVRASQAGLAIEHDPTVTVWVRVVKVAPLP
jgi:hypothetical protein